MIEAYGQAVDEMQPNGAYPLALKGCEAPESETPPEDYDTLDFKQMLAACPLDGIELARVPELPRTTDL